MLQEFFAMQWLPIRKILHDTSVAWCASKFCILHCFVYLRIYTTMQCTSMQERCTSASVSIKAVVQVAFDMFKLTTLFFSCKDDSTWQKNSDWFPPHTVDLARFSLLRYCYLHNQWLLSVQFYLLYSKMLLFALLVITLYTISYYSGALYTQRLVHSIFS